MSKAWVFAEVSEGGAVSSTALEILTKVRDIADTVEAVALGPGATEAAKSLGEYGAQTVHASDDPVYGEFLAQPAVHALHHLVQEHQPNLLCFAMDYDSRDIAGRLAVRTGSTVMTNASDILALDKAQTQIFGGEKISDVSLSGADPKIVLVRPKAIDAEPSGGSAEVQEVSVDIPDELKKAKRVETHEAEREGVKLEDATVIVSGGRGMLEPDNFEMLEEIAQMIKDSGVGATRAVVDAGWVPYAMQIGQTGKTVKPEVYIACGISGASQHQVGMKDSKAIIAVNKDPEAPIFQISDLGIVGDTMKVLPQLIEELKNRTG